MANRRHEEKRETASMEAKEHSPTFLKKAARMSGKKRGKGRGRGRV